MERVLNVLKNEDGSEIVEFVMVVPVLMTVLAYMLCFCQIIYASQVALNASNAGVRVAVLQNNQNNALYYAEQTCRNNVSSAGMGITYNDCTLSVTNASGTPTGWGRGNVCSVYVEVTVDTIMPMSSLAGFSSESIVIKGSHMMIEND